MPASTRVMRGSVAPRCVYDAIDRGLKALECFGEAALVVRLADEPGLARIGLAEHAEIVQLGRQRLVEGVVARSPVAVIARRHLAEEQPAHRGMTAEGMPDAALGKNLADASAQTRAVFGDGLQRRRLGEDLQALFS